MMQYQFPLNTYAGDGKCHSAQRGSFGHECGKPATHIGTNANAFRTGICKSCLDRGIETAGFSFEAIIKRDVEGEYAFITAQ